MKKLYSKQEISEETIKELKENPYPSYELGIIVEGFGVPKELIERYTPPMIAHIEEVDGKTILYCDGGWTFVIYENKNEIEVEGAPIELFKM
jgi:hypothetical protein